MIEPDLVPPDLGRHRRAEVKAVVDLDVRVGDAVPHPGQRALVEDVAALDRNDLALLDRTPGEQATTMDRALANLRLRRQVGRCHTHAAPVAAGAARLYSGMSAVNHPTRRRQAS